MTNGNAPLQKALNGLTTAIENIVNLEVKTVVGPAGDDQVTISTRIDLFQGDITSAIPDSFFSDENAALKAFHAEKEAQAQAIIEKNLELLVDAAKSLAEAIKTE